MDMDSLVCVFILYKQVLTMWVPMSLNLHLFRHMILSLSLSLSRLFQIPFFFWLKHTFRFVFFFFWLDRSLCISYMLVACCRYSGWLGPRFQARNSSWVRPVNAGGQDDNLSLSICIISLSLYIYHISFRSIYKTQTKASIAVSSCLLVLPPSLLILNTP